MNTVQMKNICLVLCLAVVVTWREGKEYLVPCVKRGCMLIHPPSIVWDDPRTEKFKDWLEALEFFTHVNPSSPWRIEVMKAEEANRENPYDFSPTEIIMEHELNFKGSY